MNAPQPQQFPEFKLIFYKEKPGQQILEIGS